jgi:hypothetical protein
MINLPMSKLSLGDPSFHASSITTVQQNPCTLPPNVLEESSLLLRPGKAKCAYDEDGNKHQNPVRRSSLKVKKLYNHLTDQKLTLHSCCQSPDRNLASPPSAAPNHNVRFSSPLSEILIIPGRDEISTTPAEPQSSAADTSWASSYRIPQYLPDTLPYNIPPKSASAKPVNHGPVAGNTAASTPAQNDFDEWLKRRPWRTWPVKQPINRLTLKHNLRHVRKELGLPETRLEHHMPNSAEAFQATSSPSRVVLEEPADTIHESTLDSAPPSLQGAAQDFTERCSIEESTSRMSDEAAMVSEAGNGPLQSATDASRPVIQVARKTTGTTKHLKVGYVQGGINAVKTYDEPALSQASVSIPRPRSHEDAGRKTERSHQRLKPTHPHSPSNHRLPPVSTRSSPVNGAKRKGDDETRDMRPTKRPRIPSDHEFKLMANHWANELNACDYVGRSSRQYDSCILGRLAKVMDLIDRDKEISTAHWALLSSQETNVITLLQDLTRGNGLEKRSPTRLKAKKILAYWRKKFRQASQQGNVGDSSD